MARDVGERLVTYGRKKADDSLRTIAILSEDDCEILYLRDDLKDEYDPEEYKAVADSFRTDESIEPQETVDSPAGRKKSVIHYHDHAFVFQFPHDEYHSVLMSVEPTIGSQLKSFINECQKRI